MIWVRLQGDYNATSWPQLAKPYLVFVSLVWLGPSVAKSLKVLGKTFFVGICKFNKSMSDHFIEKI